MQFVNDGDELMDETLDLSIDSFGATLRRERELRSVPLEDVARATNIQLAYLQAMEEDDYDVLPHSTFVKGFIRSYASYIGLNPDNAVTNYEHFISASIQEETNVKLNESPKKTSWLLPVVVFFLLVALAVLGYFLSTYIKNLNKHKSLDIQTQSVQPLDSGTRGKITGKLSARQPPPKTISTPSHSVESLPGLPSPVSEEQTGPDADIPPHAPLDLAPPQ